ncbi:hypothetical protein KFK09_020745 [Dendrobium nobile]|uniref:Uncharacterized protein n=1 Tax=Dendrobium nobile TaxID=94219 RepID=A0A8T3ANB2_DENNO|nr:hypothetical protein KFK09_020745 [Dendrobium nobile]
MSSSLLEEVGQELPIHIITQCQLLPTLLTYSSACCHHYYYFSCFHPTKQLA